MARKKEKSTREGFPYLSTVFLCQEIEKTEERGGLTSLIGIFDDLVILGDAPGPEKVPVPVSCYVFARLKDENPRGDYEITIEVFSPSGEKLEEITGNLRGAADSEPGNIGNIEQFLDFRTDEDGEHLVNLRFRNRILGQARLHVSQKNMLDL